MEAHATARLRASRAITNHLSVLPFLERDLETTKRRSAINVITLYGVSHNMIRDALHLIVSEIGTHAGLIMGWLQFFFVSS